MVPFTTFIKQYLFPFLFLSILSNGNKQYINVEVNCVKLSFYQNIMTNTSKSSLFLNKAIN